MKGLDIYTDLPRDIGWK